MAIKRRGQAAIEFVLLVALGFMVLAVFMIFVREHLKSASQSQEYFLLKEVSIVARGEIMLAASVSDGYERSFLLPDTLEYRNYTIYIMGSNTSSFIWASTENFEYITDIPSVAGNLTHGNNTIRKDGGVIYVNI